MKTQIESVETSARIPVRTKDEEIATLREAVRQLGPLSYCGPWLAEQLAGIEKDIRSDFFPQMDRKGAIRDCEHLVKVAEGNAREIEAAAHRIAKAKTDAAHAEACAIRGRVLSEINHCRKTLGVVF